MHLGNIFDLQLASKASNIMGRSLDILSSFRKKERVPSKAEVASPMELSTIGAQHGTYNNPEASPDSFNDRVEQVMLLLVIKLPCRVTEPGHVVQHPAGGRCWRLQT